MARRYHENPAGAAEALRMIADRLDQEPALPLSPFYVQVSMQAVRGLRGEDVLPVDRAATVDALTELLGIGPADLAGGIYGAAYAVDGLLQAAEVAQRDQDLRAAGVGSGDAAPGQLREQQHGRGDDLFQVDAPVDHVAHVGLFAGGQFPRDRVRTWFGHDQSSSAAV